ncbi:SMI1/KNR4 family protein [Flavobacterium procerum]|uniref:SMI1/KNR4 family protein n=1 Tax=Flavobacterium procerum TaxID=1455569 RepID=A0ABV6BQ28_9FLAO
MSFEKELSHLLIMEEKDNIHSERKKATAAEITILKNRYPTLPEEYFDYLLEIGSGTILESQFKVMSNLFDFTDLGLEDVYYLPESIQFFGDNFSGDFAGFDLLQHKNEVVEFWYDSNEIYHTGKTFRQYIREKMLLFNL